MTASAITTTTTSRTLLAYGLGTAATVVGVGYTAVDQLVVGSLDAHLHDLYDPVGVSGQPGPLYAYLYIVGILGSVCWFINIRLVRTGAAHARRWGWITAGVAALPVLAPVVITEYGSMILPIALVAGPLIGWVFGVLGLLALNRTGR